jgi:hypothetical protein
MLLREEMRRSRQFIEWKINQWEGRTGGWARARLDVSVSEGIRAYAQRQISILESMLASFTLMWDAPLTSCTVLEDAGEGEGGESRALDMIANQLGHSDDEE